MKYKDTDITFSFDKNMMSICLKANGWSEGWIEDDWISPGSNPDLGGLSLKEAFCSLLRKGNLYGIQFEYGWK